MKALNITAAQVWAHPEAEDYPMEVVEANPWYVTVVRVLGEDTKSDPDRISRGWFETQIRSGSLKQVT